MYTITYKQILYDKVVLIGSYYLVKFPYFQSVKVLLKEDPVDCVDCGLAYFFVSTTVRSK